MPAPAIPIIIAAAQAALSISQAAKARRDEKSARALEKPYKTPQQIYDILKATTARAGGGLSPATMQYLTGKVDSGFGTSVEAAKRLGADPNDLSSIYQDYTDRILDIGNMNELENMKNFEKYIAAKNLVADNEAAEQSSQQGLVRNRLQSASVDKLSSLQNMASAANAFIAIDSANRTSKLFQQDAAKNVVTNSANLDAAGDGALSALPTISAPSPVGSVPQIGATPTSLDGIGLSDAEIQQAIEIIRRARKSGALKININ